MSNAGGDGPAWLVAPAKLTLSLRVRGRRPDGYHELEAEMVALSLHDTLAIEPGGSGVELAAAPDARAGTLSGRGVDNIVTRALAAVGRTAGVRLEKRIPVGGGLGGGSADAAAVLRWAGVEDPAVAARLGADVPFCVVGGRALVGGLGERVRPLPFEARSFVLLVPPFSVDTAAVYRAWDTLSGAPAGHAPAGHAPAGPGGRPPARNDLTEAALMVEPRLRAWGERLGAVSGREPVLAGSGSTWWVEGSPAALGLEGRDRLDLGRDEGRLLPVQTVPAGWTGPSAAGDGAPAVR